MSSTGLAKKFVWVFCKILQKKKRMNLLANPVKLILNKFVCFSLVNLSCYRDAS